MNDNTFYNENFEKFDYSIEPLTFGEYENCTFTDCNFAKCDLAEFVFVECRFENCNFSLASLGNTALREAKFSHSKLLGVNFHKCSKFLLSMEFEDCILNLSSFFGLKMKNQVFKNCVLQEVDFTTADLTGAIFDNCDMTRAIFVNSILEKADFRTAFNYSFDPEINRIKKARFSINGVLGLLMKYQIEVK